MKEKPLPKLDLNHICIYIMSRRLRRVGYVAKMEEGRSAFKILTGKATAKRPLGRPMHR